MSGLECDWCENELSEDYSYTLLLQDLKYTFCSKQCRQQWRENPKY